MPMKKIGARTCLTSLLLLTASVACARPTDSSDCANPAAPACFVTTVFSSGSALNAAIGGGSGGFNTDPVTIKTVSDDGTVTTEQTSNADGSLTTKISDLQSDGSESVTVIVTQPAQSNPDGSTSVSQHTTNADGSTEDTTVTDTQNANGSATRTTNTSFGDGTTQRIEVTTGADGKFQLGEIDIEARNSDGTTTRTQVSKFPDGTVISSDTTANADGSIATNYPGTFTTYSHDADGSTTQKTETQFSNGDDLTSTVTVMPDGTAVVLDRYTGKNKGTSYASENDQETYADGSYLEQVARPANDPVNDSGQPIDERIAYGVQLPSCNDSACWGKWNWDNWGGVPGEWLDGLRPSASGIPAFISYDYQRNDMGGIVSVTRLEVDYVPDDAYGYNHTALYALATSWSNADWTYRVEFYEDQYIIVGRRTH